MATNQEIAHRGAQFAGDRGQTPNGNLFYENNTIYSYGYHFPIATLYQPETYNIILFNTDNYSVSTSQHQSQVSRALPDFRIKLYVSTDFIKYIVGKPSKIDKKRVIKERDNQLTELVGLYGKQKRARTYDYTKGIAGLRNNIGLLCKTFKISDSPLGTLLKDIDNITAKNQKRIKRNQQAQARKEKAKKRLRLAEAEADLKLWLAGHNNVRRSMLSEISPHLRPFTINPDIEKEKQLVVETSHGASITYKEAEQLAKLYLKITKEPLQKDCIFTGEKPKFGHYTIDKILANGDMVAGCHHFTSKVLNDFIKLNNWG
ncbi:MAG: hypothetical protein OEL54_05770 [Flavobacteriaceae bacterium]|nr:hypothetical protein [Flavobacteriaceae bacterium]